MSFGISIKGRVLVSTINYNPGSGLTSVGTSFGTEFLNGIRFCMYKDTQKYEVDILNQYKFSDTGCHVTCHVIIYR